MHRSWLESQLSRAVPPEPHSAPDLVAGDVVAAALARCGVPPAAAQRSVEAAMSVVLGTHAAGAAASGGGAAGAAAAAAAATAAAAVAAAQENGAGAPAAAAAVAAANAAAAVAAAAGARAGGGFASMFAQHVMAPSAMAAAGPPAVQSLRQVQGLLVAGDMGDLTSHLYGALVDRAGGGGAAAAGGADGGGDDAGGGAATNPERRWRATALAAHMLLALEGLGVLGGGGGGGGGGAAGGAASMLLDPFEAHKTSDLAQRLLTYYAATLLERGQLGLAPPYLCCLRPGLRGQLAGELLAAHTRRLTGLAAPDADASSSASSSAAAAEAAAAAGRAAADAECYGAYLALEHWFRRCWERQAQPAAALASCLATDIRPNELRLQLATFAVSCRHSPGYGPAARARVARWLAYPYIAALQAATAEEEERRAAAAAADGGGAAAGTESDVAAREAALLAGAAAGLDPLAALDVLDFANCCCCELALGDDVTAAAGQLLFDEVLPPGIDDAALLIAESLESGERSAGAGGEATAADGGAALRLAAALRAQAAELAGWRLYFGLDGQLARWLSRHEAAGPGPEAAALAADGCALLHDYLEQLLAPGWMRELASCSRALEAAAAGGDGAVRVSLTVTSPPGPGASQVPQAQAQGGGGGGGGGWGHPTAPYPELQGAALLEFQLALESGLRRAAASLVASSSSASAAAAAAAVQVAVEGPAAEGSPLPQGHVTVHLAAAPDARSWSALVSLLCGAVRGGLPGVPPLLLVALQADRATSLAVCRRCCVGQAVMRCAALRLSLVALGADAESPATGPQLLEMLAAPPEAAAAATDLVAAAAAGNGPGGLLELLGPGQLAQLLAVEADTAVRHLRNRQVARRLRE
ncbi:hypothetical protein CHLRE_10g425700v5 [Chlamydomonas reinhardtii]|uniref:Uncharacterized protein n=1 Tax=Chlamydomonas reinhardtii TaxID=3055 RepID=A0A2K3D9G6_CHLRE|nr:uncharacterized protein CHLRE_10g425700v5 [Chlamydomonas reinhardtii]PNW77181.1 hypothetical protein CHLRE_10g425700v5 [Chlamydomonas reinhardtii]